MCIASPILVTGSVNRSQNVYCVSDYCQRLQHMYSSIRSESHRLFHVFSEAKDHILILNILFFNKLRQLIPEIRSERQDLLIFIFILKTTGTFTPVHSAGITKLPNSEYAPIPNVYLIRVVYFDHLLELLKCALHLLF
jgi:hypothetical protein